MCETSMEDLKQLLKNGGIAKQYALDHKEEITSRAHSYVYLAMNKVKSMKKDDWIKEGIVIGSYFATGYIMKGASILAKAYWHASDNVLIGSFLYLATIGSGVITSHTVEEGMKALLKQKPGTLDEQDIIESWGEVIFDELKPWETPPAIDFMITCIEETTDFSTDLLVPPGKKKID